MALKNNDNIMRAAYAALVIVITVMPLPSGASELLDLPDGHQVDLGKKCPVCGMIVGGPEEQGVTLSYRKGRLVGFAGIAATVFKDGTVVGFDGARCLFVYNSIPSKYGVDIADMKHQYVTDFVSKMMIEVEKAFLVLGSSVKGRMGYELIPFASNRKAWQFASEYGG
ncbi:MAG: nitrous oxide reductase accessory protein NosL, partial [Deltaproteobacteria bacterium]